MILMNFGPVTLAFNADVHTKMNRRAKLEMHGKAHHVAHPAQTRLQNSAVTG